MSKAHSVGGNVGPGAFRCVVDGCDSRTDDDYCAGHLVHCASCGEDSSAVELSGGLCIYCVRQAMREPADHVQQSYADAVAHARLMAR